ncbi:MAG: cobalamin B12-binding domain-containing protein [Boseongicola sp.]|nr:cobalamin B12-binding domain-containing protein [Boseongicola sp.]MDD9976641.1 cobalamin B12-binding domain-containing protein [Boseongicola sp.]
MTDGPESMRKGQRGRSDNPVESLANEALRSLARKRGAGTNVLHEEYVIALHSAVLDGSESQRDRVVEWMLDTGVTVSGLIDLYIPEVARRLGAEWCEDDLGFAEVTVGSARLQGLLRDLAAREPLKPRPVTTQGVAIVVLSDEYHTLGALVLTAQLRRMGVSVRVLIGVAREKAIREVSQGGYDAVMISASHVETLVQIEKFIKDLNREMEQNTPIVVGGPVLNVERDVAAVTGADFATSDVVEALRLCQLRITRPAEPTKKTVE